MRKLALVSLVVATVAGAQLKVTPGKGHTVPGTPLQVGGTRTGAQTFTRMTRQEALQLYKSGRAVFIDVRSNEQFRYGHIKGALNIPGSQIVSRFAEVPPHKTVITYCACSAEQASGRAAMMLTAHGVKNVFALQGGWHGWKDAGLPALAGPK
jgi:rhodanese-related sulfurtransferase